jgi:hypothetical protein
MNSKDAINRIMRILNLTPEKFYEAKTEQGVQIKMEGELEIGSPIYVATEEGMIPAPDGTHKLDDGAEIEVVDGKVDKIQMGDMTKDAKIEEEKEKEDTKDESMSEVELEFGDVKLKGGGILRIGGDEPSVGLRVNKVGYDGTLSAIADGEYETEGGKIISIVGGSIQGYQPKSDVNPETSQDFTEAETADGAIVESPTFDVGEKIDVVKDGEKSPAPDGEHQVKLKDSEGNEVKIRVQVKDGKIVQRENVEQESMSAEKIAELFASALKSLESKIDTINEKYSGLESRFNKFSKEPAGQKVYTQKTINTEEGTSNVRLENFKRMKEFLRNK